MKGTVRAHFGRFDVDSDGVIHCSGADCAGDVIF